MIPYPARLLSAICLQRHFILTFPYDVTAIPSTQMKLILLDLILIKPVQIMGIILFIISRWQVPELVA